MAITLWKHKDDPFKALERFRREMDRLFDRWFEEPYGIDRFFEEELTSSRWYPAVDIQEKDGKYILKAELPGMKKDDIHVDIENGVLSIKGERKLEDEEKKENYHRIERVYGTFRRSFRLPENVKEDQIKAKYKDGILEITLPIKEEAKPKAIPVSVE